MFSDLYTWSAPCKNEAVKDSHLCVSSVRTPLCRWNSMGINVISVKQSSSQTHLYKERHTRYAFEWSPLSLRRCRPGVTGAPLNHGHHMWESQNHHHQVTAVKYEQNELAWLNGCNQWKTASLQFEIKFKSSLFTSVHLHRGSALELWGKSVVRVK